LTRHFDLASIGPLTAIDATEHRDLAFIEEQLDEHNMSHTGVRDARVLSIIVHDDRGEIIAGLHGFTWGGCCEIKTLWVHEQARGHRLGTSLMQVAESEARARGATQMVLSTHSFQAPAFYERLGFIEVGRVDEYPAGYSNIYFRKPLGEQLG
jgi:ribosomal protein S18 acetylase RimI-like enzyme